MSKLKLPSLSPSPNPLLLCSNFKSSLNSKPRSIKCFCDKTDITQQVSSSSQGFLGLEAESPWDITTLWSTLAFYVFSLHIPLSFGVLSVVAHVLHRPILDPQIQAISLIGAQFQELIVAILLLQGTAKPQYKCASFFKANKVSKQRSWLLASAVGFGFLLVLVFLTSFLADRFIGQKERKLPCQSSKVLLCRCTKRIRAAPLASCSCRSFLAPKDVACSKTSMSLCPSFQKATACHYLLSPAIFLSCSFIYIYAVPLHLRIYISCFISYSTTHIYIYHALFLYSTDRPCIHTYIYILLCLFISCFLALQACASLLFIHARLLIYI